MGLGLIVNSNVAATNTSRVLRRSTLSLNKSLERLSSGLRINRAADDAAGLAIAEGFNSQVRGFRVAQRNAQDGISLVQTAEGALSEIGNMMQRIRELAVQAANGTLSATNRGDLNTEAQQLISAVDEIFARVEFNGIDPFLGGAGISIQTGIKAAETTLIAGSNTLLNSAALSVTTGAINLSGATAAGANAAITAVDAGLIVLNTRRANLGAAQNRLEFTLNVLAIREENALASESAIRDADIARETTAFTRNQILVTAGTSILAQANIVPQTALQLLG
jgi:flagellin